jgi:hypothetical protein
VTRRASLPGADELFRPTAELRQPEGAEVQSTPRELRLAEEDRAPAESVMPAQVPATSSKRRHDEKITFYCTAGELTRLERARLALRADHRIAADRGRILRAALAEAIDEFEAKGTASALFRRLSSG